MVKHHLTLDFCDKTAAEVELRHIRAQTLRESWVSEDCRASSMSFEPPSEELKLENNDYFFNAERRFSVSQRVLELELEKRTGLSQDLWALLC